jgi:hypothetical protein
MTKWTLPEKVEITNALARDPRLSEGQFRVAYVLILYFHNTLTGECFPRYPQLAEAAHVSETTARRATGAHAGQMVSISETRAWRKKPRCSGVRTGAF